MKPLHYEGRLSGVSITKHRKALRGPHSEWASRRPSSAIQLLYREPSLPTKMVGLIAPINRQMPGAGFCEFIRTITIRINYAREVSTGRAWIPFAHRTWYCGYTAQDIGFHSPSQFMPIKETTITEKNSHVSLWQVHESEWRRNNYTTFRIINNKNMETEWIPNSAK